MDEEQDKQEILASLFERGTNFDEFFKPFAELGYIISDEIKSSVCSNNELWDSENKLQPDKIALYKSKGSKALVLGAGFDFNPEECEKIAEMLHKGQEVKAEAQRLGTENTELGEKVKALAGQLEAARNELRGTEEQIGGKKKKLDDLGKELEARAKELFSRKEGLKAEIEQLQKSGAELQENISKKAAAHQEDIARLESQKAELDKYIANGAPKKDAIEKEIQDINSRKQEVESAFEKASSAVSEKKAMLASQEKELEALAKKEKERRGEIEAAIRKDRKELAEVSQEIEAKKAALEAVKKTPAYIKETEEFREMQRKLNKRELVLRQMIRNLIPLGSGEEIDAALVSSFLEKLSAVKTLYAKLDAIAADVLQDEIAPEAVQKPKDSAIGRLFGKAKDTLFLRRKPAEPEPSAVEKTLEVTKYIGILDNIKAAVEAYKIQATGYKTLADKAGAELAASKTTPEQARKAPIPKAGLDEKAEQLLNDLLGAVDAMPAAEEVANPAYVKNFVAGVRQCGFEIYSLIASRDAEAITYVLADLAQARHAEGKKAEAVALTEKAIAVCREKLPGDKARLAQFEADLRQYKQSSK